MSILKLFYPIIIILTSTECQYEVKVMYKNRAKGGSMNLCGEKIRELRLELRPRTSQRMLADRLQLLGLDLDKNAIQRIESGKRFVTDIELLAFAKLFHVSTDDLLK